MLKSPKADKFNLPIYAWKDVFKIRRSQGAWVAQSVERPISAQVIISWFVSSRPVLSSALTARILEPALDSVSPFLSAPLILTLCLSLLQK